MYAIYVITNTVNAKQYVGIAADLETRWRRHRNANEGQLIHKAIKKYGVDAFVFTHIADAFDAESAKMIERMLIAEKNTKMPHGYNMTDGGDGTMGMAKTEEHKQKLKDANKKAWADPELRAKHAEKMKELGSIRKGKPSGQKGKPNGRKGIPHAPDHSAKIKESLNTPESKAKRSEAAKKALNDPIWKAEQSARLKAIWAIRKAKKEAESCL
jgi:group I intron endonuclease